MCFMTILLARSSRCDVVNKKLQSVNIDLGMVIELYVMSKILYIYKLGMRTKYINYKERVIQMCGESQYKNLKR